MVGLVLGDDLVTEREDRLLRRHVAQVRRDPHVRRRLQRHRPRLVEFVGRQVAGRHVASRLDQLQHQLPTHPARAARDDGDFSLEALHAADLGTALAADSHPRLRQDFCGPVRRNPDANGEWAPRSGVGGMAGLVGERVRQSGDAATSSTSTRPSNGVGRPIRTWRSRWGWWWRIGRAGSAATSSAGTPRR